MYTTLIKGFSRRGDADRALEIFDEMERENIPKNTVTFNTVPRRLRQHR